MCGISGIVNLTRRQPIQRRDIIAMSSRQNHRGPEHNEVFISADQQVALGHTRLSIFDPTAAGNQPMRKHGLALVLNGEVLNFAEIRRDLIDHGYSFNSRSDSEVFLSAFHRWGVRCVEQFTGFFAAAILVEATNEVYLIRDRIGIKPLVYQNINGVLLFASEIKSLMAHPEFVKRPNLDTIRRDIIFNWWGDKTESYFQGVHSVEPGTYYRIANGCMERYTYWIAPSVSRCPEEEGQVLEGLRHHLASAVLSWSKADFDFGSILSGGLDSSLITALAADHSSNSVIKCFTIDYDEDSLDYKMADLLAQSKGNLELHPVKIKPTEVTNDNIDKVTYHMEEVLLDKAYYSMYQNYAHAKSNGLRVVLNGQGSDEIWLGYYHSYSFIKQFIEAENSTKLFDIWDRDNDITAYIPEKIRRRLIHEHISRHLIKHLDAGLPMLDAIVRFGLTTHIRNMLNQEDRLSMAHAVECRVPFVDHHLVEFGLRITGQLKVRDGREKYLLRSIAQDILPSDIVTRPKMPLPDMPDAFGSIAERAFLQGELHKSPLVQEVFDASLFANWERLSAKSKWKIYALNRFHRVFFA